MSHAQRPDPVQEMARRIGEVIANSPAMENFRRQSEIFAETLQRASRRNTERLGEQLAIAMAPALDASRSQIAAAATSLAQRVQAQLLELESGFRLDVSRLDIDAALAGPFDALPDEQRDWARRVVDEATAHVDTGDLADELPDEMVDSLTDSVQAFTAAQPAGLSRAVQRKLFIGFVVSVFFTVLLQAQIESDGIKEFMEDVGGAMLIVAPAAASAAYAWDKTHSEPVGDDGETENDGA
ncbi:hypothetical protein [Streptomyces sp. NPDC055134]